MVKKEGEASKIGGTKVCQYTAVPRFLYGELGGENTFTRTYNGEEIAGNVFETDGEQQGKNENARAVMGKEQANITHIIRLSIFSRLTQFVIASNVSNKCEERERERVERSRQAATGCTR